jgi:predicted DNA-binding protein with PD1-like motif
MIITHTRDVRSFIGNLTNGSELTKAILGICVDNSIFCALVQGSGYLTDPTLKNYNGKTKSYQEPVKHEGTFHLVSMQGNVSLEGMQTVLCLHVCGVLEDASGDTTLVSGELVEGSVISVEFGLSVVDSVRLYRGEDGRTGLKPWLHLDLSSGPPKEPEVPIQTIQAEEEEPEEEEEEEADEVEIAEGDWLEHPTLGSCKVVDFDGEGRVTIRLSSNRHVELHLGLLDIRPKTNAADGCRSFQVSIKRRKRA